MRKWEKKMIPKKYNYIYNTYLRTFDNDIFYYFFYYYYYNLVSRPNGFLGVGKYYKSKM